jgi:hypothetical protein
MDSSIWYAFIKGLRADQDKLLAELVPYESATMHVSRGQLGGPMQDFTAERIATIKGEIASLQSRP